MWPPDQNYDFQKMILHLMLEDYFAIIMIYP